MAPRGRLARTIGKVTFKLVSARLSPCEQQLARGAEGDDHSLCLDLAEMIDGAADVGGGCHGDRILARHASRLINVHGEVTTINRAR